MSRQTLSDSTGVWFPDLSTLMKIVPGGQQVVEQGRELAEEPAGVLPDVEDEAERALAQQGFNRLDGRLGGAGVEVENLHVAYAPAEHPIAHGAGVHDGAVDGDLRLVALGVLDAELDRLAYIGVHEAARVADGHVGDILAVYGEDDVADGEAGVVRRGGVVDAF